MSFRRYVAGSAREAMDLVRRELGADALILSNRRLADRRVEIIAAGPEQMQSLVEDLQPEPPRRAAAPALPARAAKASPLTPVVIARKPSPESFTDFIRRQTRERGAPTSDQAVAMYAQIADTPREGPTQPAAALPPAHVAQPPATQPQPASLAAAEAPAADASPSAVFRRRPSRLEGGERRAQVPSPAEGSLPSGGSMREGNRASVIAPVAAAPAPAMAPAIARDPVMEELRALRTSLNDRIATLESGLATRPSHPHPAGPAQGVAQAAAPAGAAPAVAGGTSAAGDRAAATRATVARMLMSGFSPDLARRFGALVPADLDPEATARWLQATIARNLRCPPEAENPLLAPGAIVLTGPTGVGKTTTIAKLAARWVVRHGAASLGLVTLDSYRMGAHEQLRSYGRILGVPVHSAQDAASLGALLRTLEDRQLVLIDTCGMSQRDARLSDMLAMLAQARFRDQPLRRVVLLHAASHAETLDEVARGWAAGSASGAILTKLDEAARIGGALDCLLRYRAPLLGLTNGQRVPEDWHAANAQLLSHLALKPLGAAFSLAPDEAHAIAAEPAKVSHA